MCSQQAGVLYLRLQLLLTVSSVALCPAPPDGGGKHAVFLLRTHFFFILLLTVQVGLHVTDSPTTQLR